MLSQNATTMYHAHTQRFFALPLCSDDHIRLHHEAAQFYVQQQDDAIITSASATSKCLRDTVGRLFENDLCIICHM